MSNQMRDSRQKVFFCGRTRGSYANHHPALVHHHGARDEGAAGNAELSSRAMGKGSATSEDD